MCSRSFVAAVLAVLAFSISSTALAEEPEPAATRAPCAVGPHSGIDDADAATSADLVCHELAKKGITGPTELRMGKLGGRILVTVESPAGEQRLMINALEELPTAATRLAQASAEHRPVEEVQSVDTVVGPETRAPRVKAGQMAFKGGVVGAMPIGAQTAAAPGIALGLLYRGGSFGVEGAMRTGGGGGSSTTLTHFTLGTGALYYFTDGDVAPYAGLGLALMSYRLNRPNDDDSLSNTGLGAYVEGGVEALRTHHASLTVGLRADVPMFSLTPKSSTDLTYAAVSSPQRPSSQYIVPVSLMVGMMFH